MEIKKFHESINKDIIYRHENGSVYTGTLTEIVNGPDGEPTEFGKMKEHDCTVTHLVNAETVELVVAK